VELLSFQPPTLGDSRFFYIWQLLSFLFVSALQAPTFTFSSSSSACVRLLELRSGILWLAAACYMLVLGFTSSGFVCLSVDYLGRATPGHGLPGVPVLTTCGRRKAYALSH
jgi:hypothetical protein